MDESEGPRLANKTLSGKTALITGAVRRSGRATALELAGMGAAIAINTRRSRDEADAVQREIEAMGGKAGVYIADVANEAAVVDMVDAISRDLGETGGSGGVEILVNNAADRARVPTLELTLDEFHRIVHIILDGAFLCSRAVIPHMLRLGWGRIVNISGSGNLVGYAERLHVHAGKGGLDAMTRSLSSELAPKELR